MSEEPVEVIADAAAAPKGGGGGACATLTAGQRLQDLQIGQVRRRGPASTLYEAFRCKEEHPDVHPGELRWVLKEFLPTELVMRQPGGAVVPRHAQAEAAYQAGLKAFVREGQLRAQVQHPALVPVLRCWEQGGTAYQLMPHLEGATLADWLHGLGTPPSELWLRGMLPPLMDALEALHLRGHYHGGVSLQSIWLQFNNRAESYLTQTSRPLLLGSRAASRALAQTGAGLAAALHSGFAAVEHADGALTLRQGAGTDIYALCAVLYTAIAGRPPPPSMTRMARDDMISAPKVGRGRYSRGFLAAIDAGLAVRPHERLQSIDALRELLAAPANGISGFNSSLPGLGESATGPHASVKAQPLAALPAKPARLPIAPLRWLWPAVLGCLLLALATVGLLLQTG
jgi:hypothetical protein